MAHANILVVDGGASFGQLVVEACHGAGYVVGTVRTADAALRHLRLLRYDLLISDAVLPDMDGLDLLAHVHREFPGVATMIAARRHAADLADAALRAGACDYLAFPMTDEQLAVRVTRALDRRATVGELGRMRDELLRRVGKVV